MLHHNIFERTEESESASLPDLATHASGILGQTVEPTDSEWFSSTLDAHVKRRVHCLEFGDFTDGVLESMGRAIERLKSSYENTPNAAERVHLHDLNSIHSPVAYEASQIAIKKFQEGRIAQREQAESTAIDDEPSQDNLQSETVDATIDSISELSICKDSGDGQSSTDARSSQAAT
ncbi:hypothetical protein JCM24511_06935 [Saitozyma sp. JCM 24511]|nr:hypothetical protein JCM24511_06935 [Saitozyma sp. JCM 24511]